ncbi:MAG: hypothetical protein Q8L49_11990 [Burkholderiaceae bacterium]|nr:hypothetical protein [Burkholderiaceae bacterium]
MQAHYAFAFEREMGCTANELRGWLPGASGQRTIVWREQSAEITIDNGRLTIAWRVLQPRRIALLVLPRLQVRFEVHAVEAAVWQRFMRHFDLYTQRGGG